MGIQQCPDENVRREFGEKDAAEKRSGRLFTSPCLKQADFCNELYCRRLMNGVERWAKGNEGSREMSNDMNDEVAHIRAYITAAY